MSAADEEVLGTHPVVQLAYDLIQVESTSGHEQPMADAVQPLLEAGGWVVQRQEVAPEAEGVGLKPRFNLYARRPECDRQGGPLVLLNTHIDTVPPYIPPSVGRTSDGKPCLYGRGACDTKGILAAQLTALRELVSENDAKNVGLLLVVSEETNHSGALASSALHLAPQWVVVGEPTCSRMMRLQKGMLKVRLSVEGVACHSGYPELGKSAIDPLVDVLAAIKAMEWPKSCDLGETTLNIGILQGGQAANALAEKSEALLMWRLTAEPTSVLERVRAVTKKAGVKLEVVSSNAPVHLEVLEGFDVDVASYNTDIPYLSCARQREGGSAEDPKVLLYGPGSIHDAHARHEKIRVDELVDAVGAYKRIVRLALEKCPSSSK